ncbi:MAG: PEP-CTERM sorting domain-containing protein [Phenylobacterium sp.]
MSKAWKFRAAAAAAVNLMAWAGGAHAATITYELSGQATGEYEDLSIADTVHDFGPVQLQFDLVGDLPPVAFMGGFLASIGSGRLEAPGQSFAIDVGPGTTFAVEPSLGIAAFGAWDGSNFTPDVLFQGPGLVGFAGASPFAPSPVMFDVNHLPFDLKFYKGGDLYGARIETFSEVQFGAAVPEPLTWALMALGFAGGGAGLRRARAQQRRCAGATA